MKQQSISSFFGGGSSSSKGKAAPVANVSDKQKPVDEDVYKVDKVEAAAPKEAKPTLSATLSEVNADAVQSLTAKLDISDAADSTNASAKKRRVVDSDDDSEYGGEVANPKCIEDGMAVDDSTTDLDNADDSATDLDEGEVQAAVAKSSAKKTKAVAAAAALGSKKPPTKKSKLGEVKVAKPAELELIDTKEGAQVPYLALCKVFETIETTSKRLEITAYIRDFLLQVMRVDQEQLTHTVMLCISKIAPDHEGIELGIGEAMLIKSIASATGKQVARVKQEQQELGDLGLV
ncbi:ATP-dependent DNA ligase Cdc17, partial [Coemansia sp. RSA 2052]